jgi:hypothetical protein
MATGPQRGERAALVMRIVLDRAVKLVGAGIALGGEPN